jgi:hypothetical protein
LGGPWAMARPWTPSNGVEFQKVDF